MICFWKPEQENGFLSQWYYDNFKEDNITFNCAEQYMMYRKALLFDRENNSFMEKILRTNNPSNMRKLGRSIKNFNQEVWDENKYNIVFDGNLLKFSQNTFFKKRFD